MFHREPMLKKITKEKYFRLWNKAVKDAGSEMFANLIFKGRRDFKADFKKDSIPEGIGIMQYIKEHAKLADKATDDDYDYFIEDGYQDVFIGGEKAIEEYKKLFNLE